MLYPLLILYRLPPPHQQHHKADDRFVHKGIVQGAHGLMNERYLIQKSCFLSDSQKYSESPAAKLPPFFYRQEYVPLH